MKKSRYLIFILQVIFCTNIFALHLAKEPINVCKFFSSPFMGDSWESSSSCSEFFSAGSITPGGCQYSEIPPIRGTKTVFWFPYAFVEVTQQIGESLFADSADAAIPKAHLQLAKHWYQAAIVSEAPTILKPFASSLAPLSTFSMVSNGTTNASTHFRRNLNTWYVRMLPIPYATLAAGNGGLGDFKPYGSVRGNLSVAPGCFDGISEFSPGEWVWGNDDALLATAYAPFAFPACMIGAGVPAAVVSQAASVAKNVVISQVGNFDIPQVTPSSLGAECDRPKAPHEGLIRNFQPGSDALNPLKLCMGSLGPLLPRSGKISGVGRYRTAEIAAIKFMSMLGDSLGNYQFHLKDDDKFQLVYPDNTMTSCFNPGRLTEITRLVAQEEKKSGQDVYVFAVWRRHENCLNPIAYNSATIKLNLTSMLKIRKVFCQSRVLDN